MLGYFSAVPGMAVPGMAQPGRDQRFSYPLYLYEGQGACIYLDYLDLTAGHTLSPVPGGYYTMAVANSRAGLTVPPPGRPWAPGNPGAGGGFAPLVEFRAGHEDAAAALARGRAHTAALHAAWARGDLKPGGPLPPDVHRKLRCCPDGGQED